MEPTTEQGEASTKAEKVVEKGPEESPAFKKLQQDFIFQGVELQTAQKKLSEYEKKIVDIRDYVKKMETEIASIRDRNKRELERESFQLSSQFFSRMLPILDNFDRSMQNPSSLETFVPGIKLIRTQMEDALKNQGIERVSSVGQSFDPSQQEAVSVVPVEEAEKDGVVLEELRSGYRFQGKVIRPAQVIVGKKIESK